MRNPWLAAWTLSMTIPLAAGGTDGPVAIHDRGDWTLGPVAVVPFANHTGDDEALGAVMPELYAALEARGIPYIGAAELRPILRAHRLRTSGQVGEEAAAIIARESGAAYLLLGSLDVYAATGVPELALSARVLTPDSPIVARAASAAATGRDFPRAFDGGRVRDADLVMSRVLERLLDGLLRPCPEPPTAGARPVIVVPFDNASRHDTADEIVTSVVVSALVGRGHRVVEPGAVREVALARAGLGAGAADHRLLRALTEHFGPSLVVTGTVERFQPASGPVAPEIPAVELTARLIDSASHRLLLGYTGDRSGDDSETFFQSGRRYSVAGLAADALDGLVHTIDREREHGHGS